MARLSYPRAAEPRPAALPPGERTVGQLVAESIRMYGERFLRCLAIGVPPAALALLTAHVSRNVALVLAPTLYGAVLSASYVAACVLVLERRPSNGRLVVAWAAGWLVFAPVPFLVLAFILRGAGGTAVSTAFVLANVVISPLLFVGSALLYVDQAARVE